MQFKRYKLGDLIDVTRGTSLSGKFYATEGKYIRLTCGNFDYNNNSFKINTSKDNIYFTGQIKAEYLMKKGDIITPLTEQAIGLLGSTAIIPEDNLYIQSQDVAKITCKKDLIDPSFAFYLVSSTLVKNQLSAGAQQTKIRHTSPDKIKDCVVWIPSLEDQKKVGNLLSTIDNKIAINKQTNCDLEAMAKQLYDYWFVQFDFPNENGKPYKSSGGKMVWDSDLQKMIPEEWICISLSEILSNNKIRQVNPATQPNTLFKHLSFPSFDKCGSYEEEYGAEIHSNKIVVEESYVLAAKLNPWIKRVAWGTHEENLICSTEFVVLNPKDIKYKTYIYVMANQTSFIDYCSTSTTGTSHSQRRIKPESMKMFKFAFNEDICKKFCDAVEPMIKKQLENLRLIQSLQKQRDYLLPLLMNGQVTIK